MKIEFRLRTTIIKTNMYTFKILEDEFIFSEQEWKKEQVETMSLLKGHS